MDLRLQQLKETIHFPENNFVIGEVYNLILIDIEDNTKRIVNIRKLNNFGKMEKEICQISCTVCSQDCSCCTSGFEVSLIEYFTILRYIGISFGESYIKEFLDKDKVSFLSSHCFIIDSTNEKHSNIYELRLLQNKPTIYCPKIYAYRFSNTEDGQLEQETIINFNNADKGERLKCLI